MAQRDSECRSDSELLSAFGVRGWESNCWMLQAPIRTFIYHVSMSRALPAYKRAVYGTEVSKGKYTSLLFCYLI